MVIKTLKSILPSYSGSKHADFKKILDTFPKEYILIDEDVSLLFKAYEIGFEKEFGNNFVLEAKWEADDISNSVLEHKVEIETKYNF